MGRNLCSNHPAKSSHTLQLTEFPLIENVLSVDLITYQFLQSVVVFFCDCCNLKRLNFAATFSVSCGQFANVLQA